MLRVKNWGYLVILGHFEIVAAENGERPKSGISITQPLILTVLLYLPQNICFWGWEISRIGEKYLTLQWQFFKIQDGSQLWPIKSVNTIYTILNGGWVVSNFVLLMDNCLYILFENLLYLQNERGFTQCVNSHWIYEDSWSILTVLGPFVIWFMIVHNSDVIMSAMASQITGVSIVCSNVCSTSKLRVISL